MPSAEQIELLAQKRQAVFTELESLKADISPEIYKLERHRRISDLDWIGQRNLQIPLLERTREAGLLSAIAKFTGREIPAIDPYNDEDIFKYQMDMLNGLPPSSRSWPSAEEWKYAFSSGWKADLMPPVLREDETWELGLALSCTKDTIDMVRRPQRFNVLAQITISTGELVTIQGSHQEYRGPLQVDRRMLSALDRAFEKPQYPEPRYLRVPSWVDHIPLRAGA